jgi:hypothetical protein
MAYKPAYIWNGTSFDQIGNQAVASLNNYVLLVGAQTVSDKTLTSAILTSPTINGATLSGTLSGNHTISGNVNLTGRLDSVNLREQLLDLSIIGNVLVMDYSLTNLGFISTAPSANFTLNLTNVPTDNGKAMTVTLMVTQGATGYIPNIFQIDGSPQTIKWLSGVTPIPTSSVGKVDFYNFTVTRRSLSWTVYGNATLNF